MGTPAKTLSKDEVVRAARYQQKLILFFLVNFLLGFASAVFAEEPVLSLLISLVFIGIMIAYYVMVWRTAAVLGLQPVLYVIGMFIPLVNLVLLIHLLVSVSRVLKANNIKVGIMGADKVSLQAFIDQAPAA